MGDAMEAGMERVETLVVSLESHPDPQVREQVGELVGALLEFHRAGIARIMTELQKIDAPQGSAGSAVAREPLVESLLLLHGLHPDSLETRVSDALEQVRPALREHRGDVELLGIDEQQVKLKLLGTCNGCPSSSATLRDLIETSILGKAPEIVSIQVEGAGKA